MKWDRISVGMGWIAGAISVAACAGETADTAKGGANAPRLSMGGGTSANGGSNGTTSILGSGGTSSNAASAGAATVHTGGTLAMNTGGYATTGSGGARTGGATSTGGTSTDGQTGDAAVPPLCPTDAGAGGSDSTIDASTEPCVPGDQRTVADGTYETGCPGASTVQSCDSAGAWVTRIDAQSCKTCQVKLDDCSCAWSMQSLQGVWVPPSSLQTIVYRIDHGNGDVMSLPWVRDESACTDGGGFYAVGSGSTGGLYPMPTKEVITLCPSSCLENQQVPTLSFELAQGPCVMPD